ncbi:hypothetical protein RHGRI_011196 [Rhododendron griersonianum]|uniref:Uncharacterized protein n=1 Tax=Rhododendron griersonianum TaxID=479676 RepID=A0AAV6KL07_9ERIC|nr:hypothetical protein RHGRI_011196 [Rhododendron griersonianum]
MKAFCGVNATMAVTDLGVQIRRFCPIQGFAHSWKSVDPMAKKAILQCNRDKFDIVDGTEGNSLADAALNFDAVLRDTPATYAIVEFFAHCSMLLDCIDSHALLYVVCPDVPFDAELED